MSASPDSAGGLTRRQLLRVGTLGALALSTVSTTALLTGCASAPTATGFSVLRRTDLAILRALAPVVLAGQLPTGADEAAAVEETLHTLDAFLGGTSAAGQKQIGQLFDLMHMPVTRYALVGLSSPWEDAEAADIGRFLTHWRNSRFETLRAGYGALTQMLNMMWYLQPRSWAAIGYAPPRVTPAAGAPAPVVMPVVPPDATPAGTPAPTAALAVTPAALAASPVPAVRPLA